MLLLEVSLASLGDPFLSVDSSLVRPASGRRGATERFSLCLALAGIHQSSLGGFAPRDRISRISSLLGSICCFSWLLWLKLLACDLAECLPETIAA